MRNMAADSQDHDRFAQFKLVLLGETAVGKSSLVLKFAKGTFDENRESTIGAAFLAQSVYVPEHNATVRFEIWDTAGQERYKSLAPMYYRNANAAVVVFDLTSPESLGRARMWIRELRLQADDSIVIALVGNKVDDVANRKVDRETAQSYAEDEDLLYFETSAKTGEGVVTCFEKIAAKMPIEEYLSDRERDEERTLDLSRGQQSGCAC